MDANLLSPEIPQGFGASIIRRDTSDSTTSEQTFVQRSGRRNSSPSRMPGSPPELYDAPDQHEADIAMQHMGEQSNINPTESSTFMKGDYGFINNFTYDSDNRSLLSTVKKYDHHESRKFLIKIGFGRFFLTVLFCVLIGLTLKGYEGFVNPIVLSQTGARVFNAIMLGLSLGLGLNLASSLKSYAVTLRWSLLTKRYVSLEVFDLILGLETLTKVCKLMVISLPGIRKVRMLRNLPWFRDARDDGTRFTWIVCLVWILINIGAQVLVAALSLFWPMDPSDAMPLLAHGNITTADLMHWKADDPLMKGNWTQLEASWTYGTEAATYPVFRYNESHTDMSALYGAPLYKGDGYYEYRFLNRNPEHLYTNYLVTGRKVQARAKCAKWIVKTKTVAYDEHDDMYVDAKLRNDDEKWQRFYLPRTIDGSLAWSASVKEYCGSRCTNFTVFQDTDDNKITDASIFFCNSTVGPVEGGESDFDNLTEEDKMHVYGTDSFARIAAGSIGWTGTISNGWKDRQTRAYLKGSKWSPYEMATTETVEDLLARFTIGAIGSFDDHGLSYNVQRQSKRPVQGQRLNVEWSWVLGLMGAICLIQFSALVALITFANKSIIRDESFFSLAMLLSPVINKIGKEGMNLSGDELKRHPKLLWKRIRYDYREGENNEPNKVDIFFEGKDRRESRRSWAVGLYT